MNRGVILLSCFLMTTSYARVVGGTITYTNTTTGTNGTGFGAVYNLLTVHATGQETTEFGSVLWNGSEVLNTGPGAGGNATNQSDTQSATTIASITGSNQFGLIFNINEPGGGQQSVNLKDFSLRFMDSSGATLFDITYSAPMSGLTLTQVGGGTGGSGHLFLVTLTNSEATQFFGDASNRLGMYITSSNAITLVGGGPENFYVQRSNEDDPPPPPPGGVVPEPGTFAIFGIFLAVGAGCWFYRRQRAAASVA